MNVEIIPFIAFIKIQGIKWSSVLHGEFEWVHAEVVEDLLMLGFQDPALSLKTSWGEDHFGKDGVGTSVVRKGWIFLF